MCDKRLHVTCLRSNEHVLRRNTKSPRFSLNRRSSLIFRNLKGRYVLLTSRPCRRSESRFSTTRSTKRRKTSRSRMEYFCFICRWLRGNFHLAGTLCWAESLCDVTKFTMGTRIFRFVRREGLLRCHKRCCNAIRHARPVLECATCHHPNTNREGGMNTGIALRSHRVPRL